MLNKTSMKGQLVSKNEKTIILKTKDGQGTIPLEEIYNVKVREFSILKSTGLVVGLPIVTYIGLGLLIVILGGGM